MVLALLGRMPAQGDRTAWGGWEFEVAQMDGMRISRVLARRRDAGPAAQTELSEALR